MIRWLVGTLLPLAATLTVTVAVVYPHDGGNELTAGGGGTCRCVHALSTTDANCAFAKGGHPLLCPQEGGRTREVAARAHGSSRAPRFGCVRSRAASSSHRGRYDYDTHDGRPVVTSAKCTITSGDLDQGCDTDETTRDYARELGSHDGVDDDDAGHILAHRLGGSGIEPTNIFPQAPHDNRGDWREMEAAVYDCVSASNRITATLSWSFTYDDDDKQRPTSMMYAVSYDGAEAHKDVCYDITKYYENS